jgi:hypothetical protein
METSHRKLGFLSGFVLLVASGISQAGLITNPSLTYGNTHYLGLVNPSEPASLASEASYINNLNELATGAGPTTIGSRDYDRIDSMLDGPFDDAVVLGAVKDDSVDGDTGDNSSLQSGIYQYILGKYDGPNYGSLVWYNADGFTGDITLQSTAGSGGRQFGLSHISFFNPTSTSVPVPATLLLFGLGLLGLGFLNRRR